MALKNLAGRKIRRRNGSARPVLAAFSSALPPAARGTKVGRGLSRAALDAGSIPLALVTLLLAAAAFPAWADGGAGGDSGPPGHVKVGGSGGVTSVTAAGGNGGIPIGGTGAGGGGGGAGTTGGAGGTGDSGGTGGTGGTSAGASGASGSDVASGFGGGGGGGGGAHGAVVTTTITNSTVLSGGAGGAGGVGSDGSGGGGAGGYGVVVNGSNLTYTNTSTTAGGNGGAGGGADNPFGDGGDGGDGGIGVLFTAAGTLMNSGTIIGGEGGAGGTNPWGSAGNSGAGGAGIVGSGLTVINSGTIAGGLGGDGVTRANAITFTGGANSLTLVEAGSTITGNVVANSTADTLALGGSTNATFDVSRIGAAAQYRGFGAFAKTGASTWTLSGTTGATTPWTISAGALNASADGALGATSSGLTLDGGTLRWGASFNLSSSRAIMLNAGGGTFDTNGFSTTISQGITGIGSLTKAGTGTLVLDGVNTYTGGTTIAGGTLQVGNGGTTGSITGGVTNNGTLAFDRSDTVTFGNVISGSGGLVQQGAGTLILTGGNTYTGGTTVSAGTLRLSGAGTLGGPAGGLTINGGTLDLNGTSQTVGSLSGMGGTIALGSGTLTAGDASGTTLAASITGPGAFVKQGAGTLTLTGANSYTGGTTVVAGTLRIGNGGTTGSITGDVINKGTLAFDRSDTVTFGHAISGSGSLVQQGAGTLTLTGANSYTGGTTITAGTLRIGNGGTTGSITGDVTNNGTLAFDRSDTVTFGHAISGSGDLVQQGTGTLILNGVNTYTGGTTVASGLLEVGDASHPGASVTGDVTVQSGGTLRGHGGIGGSVNVAGGATIPGGSVGILTVAGDYTQDAASTLGIEITPDPTPGAGSSQLQVGGKASLDGTLAIQVDPGTYLRNTRYDLVHAKGGVNGTFATTRFDRAFATYLTPEVSYGANDVTLTLKPKAVAYSSGFANSLGTVSLGLEQSFDAVLGQVRGPGEGRGGVWGQYLVGRGQLDEGTRYAIHGIAVGVGVSVTEHLVLGAALSDGATTTTQWPMQARAKPKGAFVYGIWRQGGWRVAGSFGAGRLSQRTRRDLGSVGAIEKAHSHGHYAGGALRVDYTAKFGWVRVSPYVGADTVNGHYDEAREQGMTLLALHYGALSQHVSHYQAGLRLSGAGGTWQPWVQADAEGWRGDRAVTVTELLGDYRKQISSSPLPSSALGAGAGVNWHAGAWDTTLSWHGAWGSDYHGTSGLLQVRYRW